jgi:hypothetical protein
MELPINKRRGRIVFFSLKGDKMGGLTKWGVQLLPVSRKRTQNSAILPEYC